MRNLLAVTFILCAHTLAAQSLNSPVATELERKIQQDAFERWALNGNNPTTTDPIARRQEQLRMEEFYNKARRFVVLWESFATELNSSKTFNAKLAKQVSKAFHDLEKTDGWPVGRDKH